LKHARGWLDQVEESQDCEGKRLGRELGGLSRGGKKPDAFIRKSEKTFVLRPVGQWEIT